jgi:hypothetical protein
MMLDTGGQGGTVLAGGLVAVAALVVLAGRLPAHPQPGGDVRPPDAEGHGVVDQGRQLGLGLVPGKPGALEPLQHLGRAQPSCPLLRAWRRCWRPVPVTRLHELHPRT